MIFPWLFENWRLLLSAKLQNRLPHALLFAGENGIGKAQFAHAFTRALLCEEATLFSNMNATAPTFCDGCHACRLLETHAHPSVLWIRPSEGQAIKVDEIRAANEFVAQSALKGQHRIVLIEAAEMMNINASNALLKMLEEPAKDAIIILISAQFARLPATILSRCQRISFKAPKRNEAFNWLSQQLQADEATINLLLNLSYNAPLKALALASDNTLAMREHLLQAFITLSVKQTDPVKIAADLTDFEHLQFVDYCISFIMDLLRMMLGGTLSDMQNHDFSTHMVQLCRKYSLKNLQQFMDYLWQVRKELCANANLNKTLLFETILIKWMVLTSC